VDWSLDFETRLGNDKVVEWNDVQEALESVVLSEKANEVKWALQL